MNPIHGCLPRECPGVPSLLPCILALHTSITSACYTHLIHSPQQSTMPSELEQEITTISRILECVKVCREVDKFDADGIDTYTDALKRLLKLVGEDGEVGVDVLGVVMVAAVGHSGQHYWTNQTNRDLAKGWL